MAIIFKSQLACENNLCIRQFIGQAIHAIKKNYQLTKSDNYEVKLILNELIANAFVHGNKGDKTKSIGLIVEGVSDRQLKFTTNDEGEGCNYKEYLKDINCEKSNREFCEHGRGLIIVFKLCESVDFNEKGNQITVTVNIKARR